MQNRYSECIYHLYANHIFSLLHAGHLLALSKRVPQQRLNAMRHLKLRWQIRALPYLRRTGSSKYAYHEDTANWEKGWAILASMKGLQSLAVTLVDTSAQGMWESGWLELEAQIMEPLKRVEGVRHFEVVVPYASCDIERNMGGCGVKLKRPGEGEAVEGQP